LRAKDAEQEVSRYWIYARPIRVTELLKHILRVRKDRIAVCIQGGSYDLAQSI
jgi:hypothetical protein